MKRRVAPPNFVRFSRSFQTFFFDDFFHVWSRTAAGSMKNGAFLFFSLIKKNCALSKNQTHDRTTDVLVQRRTSEERVLF